jgi:hypothetical protein
MLGGARVFSCMLLGLAVCAGRAAPYARLPTSWDIPRSLVHKTLANRAPRGVAITGD